jgi:glutathione S-transferase
MRLLGRTSSINVRKVLWTATELGMTFEHDEAWGSLTAKAPRPELLALNPNGFVPVWQDETGLLWESNTICRYLAARYGGEALLPTSAFARAEVEMWMDWQASELNKAWGYAFAALVRKFDGYTSAEEIDRSVKAWNRLMGLLDDRLGRTGAYVVGASFTLADIPIGLSVHRWRRTPMPRPRLENVEAYVERLARRPAFAVLATPNLP